MEGPRKLFVEGNNDVHVIVHLLKKMCPHLPSEVKRWGGDLDIRDAGGDGRALRMFAEAIRGENGIHGIVIDADPHQGGRAADRWATLRELLARQGLTDLPSAAPSEGWIGQMPRAPNRSALGPRIGAWILPDNYHDGAMEALLRRFVPPADPTWTHAETAAIVARETYRAPFSATHQAKATLHTWLAWRIEPGRPYGRSIQSGDLVPDHDEVARRFADWFLRLFELPTR